MKKTVVLVLAIILLLGIFNVPSALAADEIWKEYGTIPENSRYLAGPTDVAVDAAGNIYVADHLFTRVKRYTPSLELNTSWGGGDGIIGGIHGSGPSEFNNITSIAVDASGNLYVCDANNNRVKRYTADGILDVAWGGGDGMIGGAPSNLPGMLDMPFGVAVDTSGNLYVCDMGNDRIQRFTPAGLLDTSWCGDGIISAGLNSVDDVGVDSTGRLFVGDNNGVRCYTPDTTTPDGTLDLSWGGGDGIVNGASGAGDNEAFTTYSITVSPSGQLYVYTYSGSDPKVLRYTSVGTLDYSWGGGDAKIGGSGTAPGQFDSGIRGGIDAQGNLYVADQQNYRVQRFTALGALDTAWCDGGIMAAKNLDAGGLYNPHGIAIDADGNMYVADDEAHRVTCYKPAGSLNASWGGGNGVIGTGIAGTGLDEFDHLRDVAIDTQGNLYVLECMSPRVKRYTPSGVLDTSWAIGGALSEPSGNGADEMSWPCGIAIDSANNLYVTDTGNHRIKRYTPTGQRDTSWCSSGILGGTQGSGPDEFIAPFGIAIDLNGNIYITETGNHRVKRYTSDGVRDTTWGGDGIIGIGTVGSAINEFGAPRGVTVDSSGQVYIADTWNNRVMSYDENGENPKCIWIETAGFDSIDNPSHYVTGIDYFEGRLAVCTYYYTHIVLICDTDGGKKLSDLTVQGETITGFSPDTLEYTVVVPNSATHLEIGATPYYKLGNVSGTGTRSLDSGNTTTLTVTATAENGESQDYIVNVLRSGEDVGLVDMKVDGSTVSGFSEGKTSYTVTAPYGARYVEIGATGNSYCDDITGTGVVKLTDDSTTFSIVAKAQDGSAKAYTLTVKKGSAPSQWCEVTMDGIVLGSSGFSIAVQNDSSKTVLLCVRLSNGEVLEFPIEVTAQKGSVPTPQPTEAPEPVPDTGDNSTDTLSNTDTTTADAVTVDIQNQPPAFAWWWIVIGLLSVCLIGAGVWLFRIYRRS